MNPKNISSGRPRLTVAEDCLLEGGSAVLVKAIKDRLTLENPKYIDAKKYSRWIGKKLKPKLYFFNENRDGGIGFPKGFAKQAVMLCRKHCAGKTPEIIDKRRELPAVDFDFQGELRPYQQEALDSVIKHDFGVIQSGTGSGKTVIALAAIAKRRQPTLILVHTKELLYQWAERIATFLDTEPGLIGDGRFDIKSITVAIVNSARKRLKELAGQFGLICVDECHRVPASLFTDVVTAFDSRYMLGLSATAFRRDGLTTLIYYYLGDRVWESKHAELEKSGAVLKPKYIQRETEFKYVYRGKYQDLLKTLTRNEARNRLIVRDIVAEVERGEGTVLVVSDRVMHCEILAKMLVEELPAGKKRVAVLTGATQSEERSGLVESIRNGELQVVVSTIQLIGEGFDCPGLHSLFLTTPIKFSGRVLQVVGRILRPEQGKEPRVFDYIDQCTMLKKSAYFRNRLFARDEQEKLFNNL